MIDRAVMTPLRKLKRVLKHLGGLGPDLRVNPADFDRFTHPVLRQAMPLVARTRFYRPTEHIDIAGWLTERERQMLYALALRLPGPILEIGSWAGLSTTAIARGIHDSRTAKRFETIDLNPTVANFRPVDGKMGFYVPGDERPHGMSPLSGYERWIRPVLEAQGGVVGELRRNLERMGFSDLVTVHVGDFRQLPPSQYGLVFCDSLHDEAEIEDNAPHLRRFLAPGAILACHDVGHGSHLIAALRARLPLGHGVKVDSLYIAETLQ